MKLLVAQLNPTVGDLAGNVRKIEQTLECHGGEAELAVFSELFVSGYPPLDLVDRSWFIDRVQRALDEVEQVSRRFPDCGILLGAPVPAPDSDAPGVGIHNAAILFGGGERRFTQHKSLLPTYDVFDEARYFDPARKIETVEFGGETLGITICEDAWNDSELLPGRRYDCDPIADLADAGATLMLNLSASPFHVGKDVIRHRLLRHHVGRHSVPFIYVNQVGANDDLIFDGGSIAYDADGHVIRQFPAFEACVEVIDTAASGKGEFVPMPEIGSLADALVLGIRDYHRKCGFSSAVLGISGGIDSAVVAALAVEALGPDNVLGLSMPSAYTSRESIDYGRELAANLGMALESAPIGPIFDALRRELDGPLKQSGTESNVTLENLQARIRGQFLMAFANRFGHLALATGNKSELATGYCTLYGDMAGGLAPLSDVPKTMVYALAHLLNRDGEVIPNAIIDRPPTAELRADQRDDDTLPPYETLDAVLQHYIEDGLSIEAIVDIGFDPSTVKWVVAAIHANEHKRRQAPPGLKVTTKAFGSGRRMPIAARYDS